MMRQKNKLNLNGHRAVPIAAFGVLLLCAASLQAQVVYLPPGSSDGLADAIAAAGEDGTVILESGLHTESGTVVLDIPVSIIGEEGAILESDTSTVALPPIPVEPALHVRNADGVLIEGLLIRPPEGQTGSCAILIEDSAGVRILDNEIIEHHAGILVQRGDRAGIRGNTVQASPRGLLDPADPDWIQATVGIAIANGRFVSITDNWVTSAVFGIFLSDERGDASNNVVEFNAIGMIFCTFAGVFAIDGESVDAERSAGRWHAHKNRAAQNGWGYLVIDGAHEIKLANNLAEQNSAYDIELAGPTTRFGFLAPTSFDNVVAQGRPKDLVVKDCGEGNIPSGDIDLVDTAQDPCF